MRILEKLNGYRMDMEIMKICSCCRKELDIFSFRKNKRTKDGFCYYCKECDKQKYKEYYQNNKEKILKCKIKYHIDKYRTDSNYKTLHLLRNRLLRTLKGINKSASTKKLLGCTIEEFKLHIESQFTEGMHWGNQGEWHLDHTVPCSHFDLNIKENQYICFNYKNLQPLWKDENLRKSNKLPDNHLEIIDNIKQTSQITHFKSL